VGWAGYRFVVEMLRASLNDFID